jgi:hypothetical protein
MAALLARHRSRFVTEARLVRSRFNCGCNGAVPLMPAGLTDQPSVTRTTVEPGIMPKAIEFVLHAPADVLRA